MCGVVGIIGAREAAKEAFLGLTTLQHRGQDAAGILTYDPSGFHRVKNLGLVDSVFNRENMETLTGHVAIGHARYSTIGRGDLHDVQPFLLSFPFGMGIVHNGNVVNYEELAQRLKTKAKRNLLTHSDTEVLLNLLADGLAHQAERVDGNLSFERICMALEELYQVVNGSFSVVTLVAGHGLLAFRDPLGIKPLVWGKRENRNRREGEGSLHGATGLPTGEAHMVASESVALAFNGYEKVRDLEPGEVLFIDLDGNVHHKILKSNTQRPCMFEWVYFASPESEIDGTPVYGARIQLGRKLARQVKRVMEERGLRADMVVPVPETSRIAAIALAEELEVPYRETLIKNQYIKRTFILDSQDKRKRAVSLKLSPVRSEMKDKRVLLVDDSIVRGTTSKKLIQLVREAGAREVFFVSTCPPIKHPCYYGIDFPEQKELIGYDRDYPEIEKELGADAVIYQKMDGLREAIADAASDTIQRKRVAEPCRACLDGCYPTDVSAGRRFAEARKADRRQI